MIGIDPLTGALTGLSKPVVGTASSSYADLIAEGRSAAPAVAMRCGSRCKCHDPAQRP